jgi:ClpP class serine protease
MTALARGHNAGWSSPFHPFSPSERTAILLSMTETYSTFLDRVRSGRKLTDDRLNAVVEGRIMSGRRGREGGLVDSRGGLREALARARSKAGLGDDAPLEIWPKERSLFERASQLLGSAHAHTSPLESILGTLPDFVRSPVVSAFTQGEHGPLTALPYALSLD